MTDRFTVGVSLRTPDPNTGPRAAHPDRGQTCASDPTAHRELEGADFLWK